MNFRLFSLFLAALFVCSNHSSAGDPLPPDVIAAFRSAERVILYSLDPSVRQKGTGFRDFRILGFTNVDDRATRQRILTTLQRHVQDGNSGALCFDPHHGIRLISGRTIHDIVICYECDHVYLYAPGLGQRRVGVSGKTDYLDAILTAAKVPLAPRLRSR